MGERLQHMYYVYILTNQSNRILYTGITNDLIRRIYEHRNGLNEGFTRRYRVHKLVYFEATTDVTAAIQREKQIKGWLREKKRALVTQHNPAWKDLWEEITQ